MVKAAITTPDVDYSINAIYGQVDGNNEKDYELRMKKTITICVVAILVVCLLWGSSWYFISTKITDWQHRGTFGDMFGAVNALFSGLAFAGMIITLLQQQKELSLQRDELKETRKELKGQKEQQKTQNETLKYQRFETTFFNLLSAFQELKRNLHYKATDGAERYFIEADGESIFKGFYELKAIQFNGSVYPSITGVKALMRKDYTSMEKCPDIGTLDHYFRLTYRIVKYVDKSELIKDKDRYDYVCLLRALLSDYELVLLFYNCLGSKGSEKFKPLVEKYALMKNLRIGLLAKTEHRGLYADGAYEHQ